MTWGEESTGVGQSIFTRTRDKALVDVPAGHSPSHFETPAFFCRNACRKGRDL